MAVSRTIEGVCSGASLLTNTLPRCPRLPGSDSKTPDGEWPLHALEVVVLHENSNLHSGR
jgi:hypothetical protein